MVESALAPDRRLHKTKPRLFCPRLALLSLSAPVSCLPVVCMFFWVCFFVCFVPCLSLLLVVVALSLARALLSLGKRRRRRSGGGCKMIMVWQEAVNWTPIPPEESHGGPLPCQAAHKGAARRRGFFYGLVKRREMSEAPPRPPTFVAWRRVVVWAPLLAPSLLLFLRGPFVLLVVNACCQKTHCAPTTARARSLGASLSLSVKSRYPKAGKKQASKKSQGFPVSVVNFGREGGL